jgi:uncharacterized protein YgiM (DUF1202 family)
MADIDRGGNKNFTVGIMKTNCWIILIAAVATGAVAQDTNTLPPIPAPVTSPATEVAPASAAVETERTAAKPAKKKKVAAPRKISEPAVTLAPGAAEVAVKNLNVRGQAGLKGEFIAHVSKGDAVTVLDQINLAKHAADEPTQWAKIALPASVKVWVRAQFVDATNKVVLPKKLNLRAGPSEDYSVLGVIERGAPVSEIITKNDWMQIEAPTNAYAFVAAMYLKQESSGNLATNIQPSAETETAATTNTIAEPQPIVTTEQTNAAPTVDTNVVAAAPMVDTNIVAAPTPVVDNTPAAPRIVAHEGVVGFTTSPNAPTDFKLYDPGTSQTVDYLYTNAKDLDLKRYVNMRIIVTGVEGLDARWQDTPVITIQRIQVLDTNAVQDIPIKHKH